MDKEEAESVISRKRVTIPEMARFIVDKMKKDPSSELSIFSDRTTLKEVGIQCCKIIDADTLVKYDHENIWTYNGSRLYLIDTVTKNIRGVAGDAMILDSRAPRYDSVMNDILVPCAMNSGTECIIWDTGTESKT